MGSPVLSAGETALLKVKVRLFTFHRQTDRLISPSILISASENMLCLLTVGNN